MGDCIWGDDGRYEKKTPNHDHFYTAANRFIVFSRSTAAHHHPHLWELFVRKFSLGSVFTRYGVEQKKEPD